MLEFPQTVLETLRQPLEDGVISINRVQSSCIYPARFMLVGAMNPCPCGFMGDPVKKCTCQPFHIDRYRSRLSGPLLDRMDIFINVPRVNVDEISTKSTENTSSSEIRKLVTQARDMQIARLQDSGKTANAEMSNADIEKYCILGTDESELLKKAVQKLDLSTRAYYRTLKLARTIADLGNAPDILAEHISEALGYRERV